MTAKRQQLAELTDIREFFDFLNNVLKLADSPVTFETYEFYKERVLPNYEEDQLKNELLPIHNFGDLLPGSRIFWISSIITEKRSVQLRIKLETILNIGNKGEVVTEFIKAREVDGVSTEPSHAKKRQWLNTVTNALIEIAIRVITGVVSRQLSSGS